MNDHKACDDFFCKICGSNSEDKLEQVTVYLKSGRQQNCTYVKTKDVANFVKAWMTTSTIGVNHFALTTVNSPMVVLFKLSEIEMIARVVVELPK